MMSTTDKKYFFLIVPLSMIISILISCNGREGIFKLKVIRSGNGWGYDITANNRPYIHQPCIPAVAGNIPFNDRKTARKTGRIVLQKLRDRKSPGLTREEVEQICKPENETGKD